MVIIDEELQKRHKDGDPIHVALVGSGNIGQMIALQLLTPIKGMMLVAIANRTIEKAERAYREGGNCNPKKVVTLMQMEESISKGDCVVTSDASLICDATNIDVVIEATGTVEFGAIIVKKCLENRKHTILVNAELDSTLGPILKLYAQRAGVVITNTDGDEPGVAMNLYRYLKMIGLKPVAAGNLKGMIDFYRTPDTQKEFAAKYNQNPAIMTSFADGTKLSMEATVLANATGFRVGVRGMFGPRCNHVNEIANLLPIEKMLNGGLVDYALGAAPYTGAFVVVHEDTPAKIRHLNYLKMGDGPFFVFYTPYHLPHIQVVSSIARAALAKDETVTPAGAPVCDVVAIAKRELREGEVLDGVGGFCVYGLIENYKESKEQDLLPMGVAKGCRIKRNVPKDQVLTYRDVELPPDRFCDELRKEQESLLLIK